MSATKFAWNEKTAAFFVAAYVAKLEEDKIAANSEEFLTSLMTQFAAENDGLQPVSVRSVRQKLAAEKVYVKLEAAEKPKTPRQAKGKKINQVAAIAAAIAAITGEEEETIFSAFESLENANVSTLLHLESVLKSKKLAVIE
jgi:hypothetical protein